MLGVALRGGAIALLVLIAGLLVREYGRISARGLGPRSRLRGFLRDLLRAYFADHLELWRAPFIGVCSGNAAVFFFSRALFDDGFEFRGVTPPFGPRSPPSEFSEFLCWLRSHRRLRTARRRALARFGRICRARRRTIGSGLGGGPGRGAPAVEPLCRWRRGGIHRDHRRSRGRASGKSPAACGERDERGWPCGFFGPDRLVGAPRGRRRALP